MSTERAGDTDTKLAQSQQALPGDFLAGDPVSVGRDCGDIPVERSRVEP